ncbi:hypothetical protein J7I98_37090 [Streptomyces sp. ISL-98]|uniref:hypothetical protein n=1 Tax=Streptomyces sp. ISL-98 TaxID=2819192 RepID=UPI001BEB8E75|nr:hypothetical protein [Streptomyces sp. ISL-98]MBT2511337.1 hypothetical protein [Streptomyces sp. ISL-98]
MSNEQNQGAGQPSPAPASPAPAPQQDVVDIYTDPALIGTDKKNDTNPVPNKAARPQGNTETR